MHLVPPCQSAQNLTVTPDCYVLRGHAYFLHTVHAFHEVCEHCCALVLSFWDSFGRKLKATSIKVFWHGSLLEQLDQFCICQQSRDNKTIRINVLSPQRGKM